MGVGRPLRFRPLEADVLRVQECLYQGRGEPVLHLVLGAELEAAKVGVAAHLLGVDLLGVVIDLCELGSALLRYYEDVAPAPRCSDQSPGGWCPHRSPGRP